MYDEKTHENYWRYYETRQEKMFNLASKRKKVTSLLDVGAGVMYVKTLVDPDCMYTPVDFIKRSDETRVVDLNSSDYSLTDGKYDLGFCSGILEWLHDVDTMIGNLAKCCDRLVLSYDCTDTPQNFFTNNVNVVDFRTNVRGYENHYSKEEVIAIAAKHGFSILVGEDFDEYVWQPLLYFEKKRRPVIASKRFIKR